MDTQIRVKQKDLDALLIRACKGKDPITRLRSIYYRHMRLDKGADLASMELWGRLAKLCDRRMYFKAQDWGLYLHPMQWQLSGITEQDDHFEKVLKVLCRHIKLYPVDKPLGKHLADQPIKGDL